MSFRKKDGHPVWKLYKGLFDKDWPVQIFPEKGGTLYSDPITLNVYFVFSKMWVVSLGRNTGQQDKVFELTFMYSIFCDFVVMLHSIMFCSLHK